MPKFAVKLVINSVKISIMPLALLLSSYSFASSECVNLKGSEKKKCEINKQITIAIRHGNDRKVDGLNRALEENTKNCTNKGLRDELIEEIQESKEDIAEYETDLKEAITDQKKDKVSKYQKKIYEEQAELKSLEKELADLE